MPSHASTAVLSALLGASVATAVCAGIWQHHDAAAAGPTGDGAVKVLACAPDHVVSMRIQVTNTSDRPWSYNLLAYWFTSDGAQYLVVPVDTGAIAAGRSAIVKAGNPLDSTDWKPGLTCQARVESRW